VNLYDYQADVRRVVDGDTYDFEVDLGFHVKTAIRVRMVGVDTHETYGVSKDTEEYERGMEEKRFVEDWFDAAEDVIIRTEKDGQGKYGRWLARVYDGDPADKKTECLNARLIEEFDVAYE
jgi:micrococcal nuclease